MVVAESEDRILSVRLELCGEACELCVCEVIVEVGSLLLVEVACDNVVAVCLDAYRRQHVDAIFATSGSLCHSHPQRVASLTRVELVYLHVSANLAFYVVERQ